MQLQSGQHGIFKGSLVVVKKVLAAEADIVLCAIHVILQCTKGHLWLNHPELSQVAARVAVCRHSGWGELALSIAEQLPAVHDMI